MAIARSRVEEGTAKGDKERGWLVINPSLTITTPAK
jgi:hypothetical protein